MPQLSGSQKGESHVPKLHLLVLNLSHRAGFYAARTPDKQWSKKTTVLICREQKVKPRKTSNIITFFKLNSSIKHCKLMFSQSVLAVVFLEHFYFWLGGAQCC